VDRRFTDRQAGSSADTDDAKTSTTENYYGQMMKIAPMIEPETRDEKVRQADVNNVPEDSSEETRLAFTLAKLLRKILLPEEKNTLVKSLTDGPKIENGGDNSVLCFASQAIRHLPSEQWEVVLSLLSKE
jgi:hypothetical protein